MDSFFVPHSKVNCELLSYVENFTRDDVTQDKTTVTNNFNLKVWELLLMDNFWKGLSSPYCRHKSFTSMSLPDWRKKLRNNLVE